MCYAIPTLKKKDRGSKKTKISPPFLDFPESSVYISFIMDIFISHSLRKSDLTRQIPLAAMQCCAVTGASSFAEAAEDRLFYKNPLLIYI